jgi:hypothetical protein
MFDPHGTLARALWIGGGQWAGKSTAAHLLAVRHGLIAYHYDYHDARGHEDRRIARRVRLGAPPDERTLDEVWVRRTPEQMAEEAIQGFRAGFEWALDDLRALDGARPVIAEGWGLRPELVAPLLDSPRRMVVLTPTEAFRRHQLETLPRAAVFSRAAQVSDPARAQANRVARDRLVAEDAVRRAREAGIRVIEVDGTLDAEAVAQLVAEHFAPFLDAGRSP